MLNRENLKIDEAGVTGGRTHLSRGDRGTYPHVTPSMSNRRIRLLHVFILRQQHVNMSFFFRTCLLGSMMACGFLILGFDMLAEGFADMWIQVFWFQHVC